MTRKRDHGDGAIDQRGKDRWRLRYWVGGKRYTKTVRGSITDARTTLRALLKSADDGQHVAPDKTTIREYLRMWIDGDAGISPKTRERYRQLAEHQIIPHLGAITLQDLRPVKLHQWHSTLLKSGGKNGRPLSARTVGHAHRVLHRALERALRIEIIPRNVAALIRPPKVQTAEITILTPPQMAEVLVQLDDHPLYPVVALALGTGMRRGELCALAWGAVNLDEATVRVDRSLEETAEGLRFKSPKTRHGRRTVSLPASVVDILRAHRRQQNEQRLRLGLGGAVAADLVFALPDGSPYPPDKLSRDWLRAVTSRKLPRVMFHALRHSHVSALIGSGQDILTISRRIGHANPAVTLAVYAHQFGDHDGEAAAAIDAALRGLAPVK
jgi:integrase